MMRTCLVSLGLVAFCAIGCGDDTGTGGAGGAPSTTSNGSTSGGGTTKSSGSTSGSTTSASTTASTSGSTSSTSASNSSTGANMQFDCTADPQGDACIECAKENCCDEAQVCAGDPECGACLDCIETSGDITACLGSDCNLQDPRTQTAGLCIQQNCGMDCGLGG